MDLAAFHRVASTAVLLFVGVGFEARAAETTPPELAGIKLVAVVGSGETARFFLYDAATRQRSTALPIGSAFAGATVVRGDPTGRQVTLSRNSDGARWTLTLGDGQILPAEMAFNLVERGIALEQLIQPLEKGGVVQFSPTLQDRPVKARILEVVIATSAGNFVVRRTAGNAAQPLNRESLPPPVAAGVTDADLTRLSATLKELQEKWLKE